MDLALWNTAVEIGKNAESGQAFLTKDPAKLATDFKSGVLPIVAQSALSRFMEKYGMRGVGEIDFQ